MNETLFHIMTNYFRLSRWNAFETKGAKNDPRNAAMDKPF